MASGGALGALARVGVATVVPPSAVGWPWATLIANLSGALLLGGLLRLVRDPSIVRPWVRTAIGTGLLGGYTTFSTLSLEILRLGSDGHLAIAAAYAATTLVAGLVAVWAGAGAAVGLRRALRVVR